MPIIAGPGTIRFGDIDPAYPPVPHLIPTRAIGRTGNGVAHAAAPEVDPQDRIDLLLAHLGTRTEGLTGREAQRRLDQFGPNEITRTHKSSRWRELARQLAHPLALLLWVAAVLSLASGDRTLALAIVAVILLSAALAYAQELQAERATEALKELLPVKARVRRDGADADIPDAYRRACGDPGPDALIAFYAAYRALVRAKVALLRGAQLPGTSAEHGQHSAHARDLVSLAERFGWRARRPLVIVVCGVPASGKSHLAQALAELSGLPHLSSDVIRKRLAGLRPTERAPGETYGADWNERTYAELGRRASEALAGDGGAIVDATFRHRDDRRAFTAALGARRPLVFIECQAPGPVLARRAAHREQAPDRVSDASPAVVLREQSRWEALDEIAASAHLTVRTDRPVEQITADVLALLDRRLAELALA
jgi:predicted kinase